MKLPPWIEEEDARRKREKEKLLEAIRENKERMADMFKGSVTYKSLYTENKWLACKLLKLEEE